jgi:hypothetical protein
VSYVVVKKLKPMGIFGPLTKQFLYACDGGWCQRISQANHFRTKSSAIGEYEYYVDNPDCACDSEEELNRTRIDILEWYVKP